MTGRLPDEAGTDEAVEVLARCDVLGHVSADRRALQRFSLTPEHRTANEVVTEWMRTAGLTVRQDAAGNLIGRREGVVPDLPAVVFGSHLDTVADAGRYDGTLGVLLGIAIAARVARRREALPFALEVVAFWDEEGGRFGTALFGSRAMAGTLSTGWRTATDAAGVRLPDALTAFGLDPDGLDAARRSPSSLLAYVEPHIEQRPYLERLGRPLGVAGTIAGAQRMVWTITGESAHAGTPYDARRDALRSACELIPAVHDAADARDALATVGRLEVRPGAANTVPGEVTFTLDYRAVVDGDRVAGVTALTRMIEDHCSSRGLSTSVRTEYAASSVECSPHLGEVVRTAISPAAPKGVPVLTSIAGHDAMSLAGLTESTVLFVRCAGGVSHSPAESVTAADVAAALGTLDRTLVELLTRDRVSVS